MSLAENRVSQDTPHQVGKTPRESSSSAEAPLSPLERFASTASQMYAPGAHEPTMVATEERRHQYVFARLSREMPLPGKWHYYAMV
jgi:hypothetical protein